MIESSSNSPMMNA